MIPADIDPTLCAAEPALDSLDDGFSPPAEQHAAADAQHGPCAQERALGPTSPF